MSSFIILLVLPALTFAETVGVFYDSNVEQVKPRRCTGFRTVYDFANMSAHPNAQETTVAKGSELCDIPTSAAGNCEGKKSSYTVADEMQADGEKALHLISTINAGGSADLQRQ